MKTGRWAGAALGLVLAACSAGSSSPSASGSPSVSVAPSASVAPSPLPSPVEHTATVLRTIPLEGLTQAFWQMAIDNGVAWLRLADGSVARLDIATGTIVTIPVGTGQFGSLAVGEGAVWVTTFDEDTVSRIDPATNSVVAVIPVGTNPEGIAVTPGAVWVSNHRDGSIWRIDPVTNAVVAKVEVGPTGPSGPKFIVAGFDALWTAVPNANLVIRLDPETNQVTTIDVLYAEDVIIGPDFVYATDGLGQLNEIQPDSNEVVRHFSPVLTPWFAADGGFWRGEGSDLLRLDAPSFAATEIWHVPGEQHEYNAVTFTDGSFWLVTDDGFLLEVRLAS